MYEVYWMEYGGRDAEPMMVFETDKEAEEYCYEIMSEDRCNLAPDEDVRIHDVKNNRWW